MDIILDKVCEELEKIEKKLEKGGDISSGEWKMVAELVDMKKNIMKTEKLEDELDGGYSGRDGYDRGSSYANMGDHYVRGHYARADRRRDDRGRYSRADGRSKMMEHLEMALDTADEHDRDAIRRFMRNMENA